MGQRLPLIIWLLLAVVVVRGEVAVLAVIEQQQGFL
jgi:hypothetical protein